MLQISLILERKNATANKRRVKITPRCKKLIHFGEKILKKLANSKNYRKVRDHCHYTGKYRSATHSICNLKFNVLN